MSLAFFVRPGVPLHFQVYLYLGKPLGPQHKLLDGDHDVRHLLLEPLETWIAGPETSSTDLAVCPDYYHRP